jgi:hypothetical protein
MMLEFVSFAIALVTLLVTIAAFMIGDPQRYQGLRFGLGVLFLALTLLFALIGVFALIGNSPNSPRLLDISTPAPTSISRFEVRASVWKNQTGIFVDAGDVIRVDYLEGQWTGDSSHPDRNEGCGFTWHDSQDRIWLFPPEQRGAALVGYIDNEPFFIGCRPSDIIAPISGELFLGMSDCLGCYSDNVGQLYVRISVRKP